MRIRISTGGLSGGVLAPIDPPPPIDINDLFDLEFLTASKTTFKPFEEIEIEWSITSKDPDNVFSEHVFSIMATEGVLANDVGPTGSITFTPLKNTLVRVQGRKRSGGNKSTLGTGLALAVDESNCQFVEILQTTFDALVFAELDKITTNNAEIRLRRVPDPDSIGPTGVPTATIELQPVATWTTESINYYFPLEIDLENFFNADLDVSLEIQFQVDNDQSGFDLDVTIDHDSDVDFSAFEDVVSLGHSATVAKTLDKVLPLLFDCTTTQMERDVLRAILQHPGVARGIEDNKRLLAFRIVPLGNFTHLSIVLCDPTPSNVRPAPPSGGVLVDR